MAIDYEGIGGGVPRKTAHIFAKNADANDVTVFGSTLDHDTQYTTDIADIQNNAYEIGWRDAVISNKNYPLLADMNGVMLTFSQQIAYLLQHGLAQWDSSTEYYTYDIVNVNGVLYISTDDNNINNNPTTFTKWAIFYDPGSLDYKANIDLDNLSPLGEAKLGSLIRWVVNDGQLNSRGKLTLINATTTTSDRTDKYAQAGSYPINIPSNGTYAIALIGGGGQGAQAADGQGFYRVGGGGSAGGFKGTITLTAGTYTITVGGAGEDSTLKNSSNTVLLRAGKGGKASATALSATGGTAGALTVASGVTVSTNTIGSNVSHNNGQGYAGSTSYVVMGSKINGASSIYNGYGKGGSSDWGKGSGGYFQITYPGTSGSKVVEYNVDESNPLTIVNAQGVKTTLYGVNNDNIGSLANGTYNKFVDADGADFIKNTIYRTVHAPSSPSANDVWAKMTDKLEVFKYNGSEWEEYNRVWLGSVTITSGAVSSYQNTGLYYNGFDLVQSEYDKSLIAGYAMPSDVYDTLTWGASGTTYTAPANGYFIARFSASGAVGVSFVFLAVTDGLSSRDSNYQSSTSASFTCLAFVPVLKGQIVSLNYSVSGTISSNSIRFYYADGSQSFKS